jgi:hypothetical protein
MFQFIVHVENDTEIAKDNAIKAEGEIAEANKISKGNSRKMCCIIVIIVLTVGALAGILLGVLL